MHIPLKAALASVGSIKSTKATDLLLGINKVAIFPNLLNIDSNSPYTYVYIYIYIYIYIYMYIYMYIYVYTYINTSITSWGRFLINKVVVLRPLALLLDACDSRAVRSTPVYIYIYTYIYIYIYMHIYEYVYYICTNMNVNIIIEYKVYV
jgi:hypothetical protein